MEKDKTIRNIIERIKAEPDTPVEDIIGGIDSPEILIALGENNIPEAYCRLANKYHWGDEEHCIAQDIEKAKAYYALAGENFDEWNT